MAPFSRFRRNLPAVVPDDVVIQKALDAVAQAVLAEESVSKSFLTGNAAKMPGSSWSGMGQSPNNSLIQRVTQNLAGSFGRAPAELEVLLAQSGLSWGAPFPPGRPLDPFWGYRRPPRTWDYSVGENVQLTPRWNRISFATLKALTESYDVAQICIRHLINDVRSLDYQFMPPSNVQEDVTDDVEFAEKFFEYPDGRQPFRSWIAEFLQDVLRYDAGSLYIRRDEGDRPIALEVVSGATIIPLVDFFGRMPLDSDPLEHVAARVKEIGGYWDGQQVPAFLQIIEGMPWVWLSASDILYQPWFPMPDSQYGQAPLEATLLMANTSVRYQWYVLQYFTEGTIPAGFMEAPPDLSDPVQVQRWQETWDSFVQGDQSMLRKIRWVPAGSNFVPIKPFQFDVDFPLVFDRRTMASFGVTPNDLGWTEDVNRSTGDTQIDVQFRVGTLPLVKNCEDIINTFIKRHLKLKARIQFDVGREVEDRLATAQAEEIYIRCGVLSADEPRMRLGKRISRERPTPRIFDNTRSGPIPLLAIDSLAGKIDPTTYGPALSQELADHPYVSAPGVAPVINSSEYREAGNATVALQRNLLIQNQDPKAPKQVRTGADVISSPVQATPAEPPAKPQTVREKDASPSVVKKEEGAAPATNLGGPGVTGSALTPTTITGGISVDTNLQGVDLSDDEESRVKKMELWERNSIRRVKKGKAPKLFMDMRPEDQLAIWPVLKGTTTPQEVQRAFGEDPTFVPSRPSSAGLFKGSSPKAAGVLVQAENTGRVLMVQRKPDKHDPGEAYARWEFPGGCLDDSDDSELEGAIREWSEETGAHLPAGTAPEGHWVSPDGNYWGFVMRVPSEDDLTLAPQPEEVSNASWVHPEDLDDPVVRDKVTETLALIRPLLKEKKKTTYSPQLTEQFHRSTDEAIAYYRPLVLEDLRQVVPSDVIRHAIRAGQTTLTKAANPNANAQGTLPNQVSTTPVAPVGGVPGSPTYVPPTNLPGTAGVVGAPLALGALGASAAVLGAQVAAVNAVLAGAALSIGGLVTTLVAIYSAGALEGAYQASQWTSGPMGDGMGNVPGGPGQLSGDLDVSQFATGGVAQLLESATDMASQIAKTELSRIGATIAKGIEEGWSPKQILAAVEEIISDESKALQIAETEYLRALFTGMQATYEASEIAEVAWVAQEGACSLCLENLSVSPRRIDQGWPNGNVPVHPSCRCCEVPVLEENDDNLL